MRIHLPFRRELVVTFRRYIPQCDQHTALYGTRCRREKGHVGRHAGFCDGAKVLWPFGEGA